jgi:predicted DNA-binding transcriptional regulator AlpA
MSKSNVANTGRAPLPLAIKLRKRESAMSAKDLAGVLACTSSHVLRRAKRGRIPNFRDQGLIRFDPEEIADWLEQKRVA